jgi:large subunit ribosomal protein L10
VSVIRQTKEEQVKDLSEQFEQSTSYYLLDFKGLPVRRAVELRKKLRENSYSMKVVKNRLALRALKEDIPKILRDSFVGPTALVFARENPIELARLIKEFSVQHKVLAVKAGMVEGQFLPGEQFGEIANLFSRNDLVAKLGYLMAYPLTQMLRTLRAPLGSMGVLLDQLKTKK